MSKGGIVLFLLNKKGYKCLEEISRNKSMKDQIDFVVLAKDVGNKEDFFKEMKGLCSNEGILFYERKEDFNITAKYSIAIGWRWLIRDVKNLIVIHDSLLPKYRGFSPLPNMLINGEKSIGATAIFASNEMDKGDIIIQKKTNINYPIKIEKAINLMSNIYCEIILELFQKFNFKEKITITEQDHNNATYSLWRDNEDYFIDWNQSANKIVRFVNSVGYPYDGAKTYLGDKVITIDDVSVFNGIKIETKHVGKILMYKEGNPVIICKKGAVIIRSARTGKIPFVFKKLRQRLR